MWYFNTSGNKRLNGRPLVVANLSTNDYQKTLNEVPRVRPELLVFNSLAEARQFGPSVKPEEAVNVCAPNAMCLAVIPTWVEGDDRVATTEHLHYIQSR